MLKKDKNFEFALEIIGLNKDKVNTNIKEFLYNCMIGHPIVTDEILIYMLYIFDEADILPFIDAMVDYCVKEKDQLFLGNTVKYLYSKLKEMKNNNKLEEDLSNSKLAQELIDDDPNIYAVLYGCQFKQQPEVEIYPEEFYSEEDLRRRINQIVKDYHKYSEKNPMGNRYAKESDFYFYVKYKR